MALTWPGEPPVLGGELVSLRPWRADDKEAVFAACQDPDILRWTTIPVPYLPEHAAAFVGDYAQEQWQAHLGTPFCIASNVDDSVLGSCDLFRIDESNLVAEVGYWVAPWARGRRVMTQALTLLARWAMGEVGFGRLEVMIEPDNMASRAVAEGAGCAFEGILRSKVLRNGHRLDLALYALV
jgi:RimJ/RimL family protein N-acetyltransferase